MAICLQHLCRLSALALLFLGAVVVSLALGLVLAGASPVVLPLGFGILAIVVNAGSKNMHGRVRYRRICRAVAVGCLCLLIVAWPFLTCIWLGPMSAAAVLAANLVFIASIILTVWTIILSNNYPPGSDESFTVAQLDEDLHRLETASAEQDPLWGWHLFAALADWYQLSALAFNVPSLLLPAAVKDLLNAFFALGRLALPFVPAEAVQVAGFLLANVLLFCCVLFASVRLTALMLLPRLVAIWIGEGHDHNPDPNKKKEEAANDSERIQSKISDLGLSWMMQEPGEAPADLKVALFVTSTLIGYTQANLEVFVCKQDELGMVWAGNQELQCWTGVHSAMAWAASLVLVAVLPAGFLMGLTIELGAQRIHLGEEFRPARLSTHGWFLLLERPVKLLAVAMAIQSEAFGNTRLRLIALTVGALMLALLSQALSISSHMGLSHLRQVALFSAVINGAGSLLTYEISDEQDLTGTGLLLAGHAALFLWSTSRSERLLSCPASARTVRCIIRLLLLVLAVGSAAVLGFLPDLLAINTGAYTERKFDPGLDMSIRADSCALFVKSTDCNDCQQFTAEPAWFSGSAGQGQLKIWSEGAAAAMSAGNVSTSATVLEACELWLLMLPNSTVNVECHGECTLHAQGSFVGA